MIQKKYLFNWEEITKDEIVKLINVIKSNYDADWVKTAKITRIDNGKTIIVIAGEKNLSLNLNNENTELNLKIDNDKTYTFNVLIENGINIYQKLDRKDGRPKANAVVSEKYVEVFKAIPDSSTFRFKDIKEKLPDMSRSTISSALKHLIAAGIITRTQKSRKIVEYSKVQKVDKSMKSSLNILHQKYQLKLGPNADDFFKLTMSILTTNPAYHQELLSKIKDEGKTEDMRHAQTLALNSALCIIEWRLIAALQDYAREPITKKKNTNFNNDIQFYLIPLLKDLTKLLDNIVFDDQVFSMLRYKSRDSVIQEKEFNMLEGFFSANKECADALLRYSIISKKDFDIIKDFFSADKESIDTILRPLIKK